MRRSKLIHPLAAAGILALTLTTGAFSQTNQSMQVPMQIRIQLGNTSMTATLEDSPSTRDFLAMLPLTLPAEDYSHFEKIAYLPGKLSTEGAPAGATPSAGDVSYYAPWGNLALFHTDFSYSAGLVKLGRIDGAIDGLRVKGDVEMKIELVE